MPGNDHLQRLRQNDETHHLPVVQAERLRALILALGHRLKAAAHHLRHIGGGEQRDADQAAQQRVDRQPVGRNSGSMSLAMNRTVISGTPRTNSMKTIETN